MASKDRKISEGSFPVQEKGPLFLQVKGYGIITQTKGSIKGLKIILTERMERGVMAREIGDELLEKEVTGKEGTVLLLVYATWCGDCQRILPVLNQFSTLPEYNQVSFLQMNVIKIRRPRRF